MDIGLNQKGHKQARELATQLKDLEIGVIVTSDLIRAKRTAQILNKDLGLPLELDPRLRECSFGDLEGQKWEIALAENPDLEDHRKTYGQTYDFIRWGGENYEQVLRRQRELLAELECRHADKKTIMLVGHGRSLRTLLSGLGYDPEIVQGEYRLIEYPKPKPRPLPYGVQPSVMM
jgi:broad specificity phosphatase PhoE